MKFKERLKEIMLWKGLKQQELADMLGIDQSNIPKWLKGKSLPSLEIFYRLCLILHEESDYLLGLKD